MRFRGKLSAADMQDGALVKSPADWRGRWREKLSTNDIHLEIGCGRGDFIAETAAANPNVGFIALERLNKMVPLAVKCAQERGVGDNLLFINADARHLPNFFDEGEIARIYINFCDPWRDKAKWHKRRLTHGGFLQIYKRILTPNGQIVFKTDDRVLFNFSLREFAEAGFEVTDVTYDLHKHGTEGKIMTNYEKRFVEQGKPIYRCAANLY